MAYDKHIFLPTTSIILQPLASIQTQLIFSFSFDAIDFGVTATHRELVISKSLLSFTNQRAANKSKHSTGSLSNHDSGPPEWTQAMEFIKRIFTFFYFNSFENLLLYIDFNQSNQNYTYFDIFCIIYFQNSDGHEDSITSSKKTNVIDLIFTDTQYSAILEC